MDQISQSNLPDEKLVECSSNKVSLETELSETLYNTLKDIVLSNPTWDQYKLINSALATFLMQNGCTDNSVSEIYLNQLFTPSKSSLNKVLETSCSGFSISASIKSPSLEASSLPIGVSKEIGS